MPIHHCSRRQNNQYVLQIADGDSFVLPGWDHSKRFWGFAKVKDKTAACLSSAIQAIELLYKHMLAPAVMSKSSGAQISEVELRLCLDKYIFFFFFVNRYLQQL